MEALIEVVGELLIEIFGQLFSFLVVKLSDKVVKNTKLKKIISYCIAFFVFSCSLVLLILALIYKKELYVLLVCGYFLLILILYIIRYICQNILHASRLHLIVLWINRIVHYVFPFILIIVACNNPNVASIPIVSCSVIAIMIYISVNVYRYHVHKKEIKYENFKKRTEIWIGKYEKSQSNYYIDCLNELFVQNPNNTLQYLSECSKDHFCFFMKHCFDEVSNTLKSADWIDTVLQACKTLDLVQYEWQFKNAKEKI